MLTDKEIKKAIKENENAAPELMEGWFKHAQWLRVKQESFAGYLDYSIADFLKHKVTNYHF